MAIDGAASLMTPNLFWIAEVPRGRLAIMARPRAGDWLVDEMAAWYAAGLTDVICLLEDLEVRDLGLEHEAQIAREAGLRFERFPIPDRGVPATVAHARALWVDLADRLRAGRSVGIHCRAGIGRSSLMAAGVLREIGVPEDHAWVVIAAARGLAVPDTEAQRAWLSQTRLVSR
jgi:protein-tyrosine phosphatase